MGRKILILNCSPRYRHTKDITIPRNTYDVTVPGLSSCTYIIEKILITVANDYILYHLDDVNDIEYCNIGHIRGCMACYECLKNNKCNISDEMQNVYPKLENCTDLIVVSPLYYGTISPQFLSFFTRLYPYWISSKDIDPMTGKPNVYPQPKNVYTIGTCADTFQNWDLFDHTVQTIYKELGWNSKDICHLPNIQNDLTTQSIMYKFINKISLDY